MTRDGTDPHNVDEVLARPKRLAIVAHLYHKGPTSMAELRRALGVTWGCLYSNLKALRKAGYVDTRITLTPWGPRTIVTLTPLGRRKLRETLEGLEKLLKLPKSPREEPHRT
ncbi:MAG: transcriptional regulator [Desulfurococcales archaeon]|nr:transcriptional regulator [Desulfurococcales archaeon]